MLSGWVQCAVGWGQGNEVCYEGKYWRLYFTRVSLNCSGKLKQIHVHGFKSECSKYVYIWNLFNFSYYYTFFFPTEDSVHWSGSRLFRKDILERIRSDPLEMVTIFMSDSLQHFGLYPARLLCPWNSPGKNTGVDCHSFLQGIFLTQGLNLDFLRCRQILYCLSHWGSPTKVTVYPIWFFKISFWGKDCDPLK